MVMKRPFIDAVTANRKERKFSPSVDQEDLVWHRDRLHRYITVVESKGWSIQFENSLPISLVEGMSYFIESDEWHRLLKGSGRLVVEIEEI